MAVNGVAAANTLYSYSGIKYGMCLYYVWQAYKANGASTGRQAGTAYEGWQKSDGKHPGDRNPPAGVPVWFGPKASSSAGDVVISLGGGKVVATDWPSNGHTGICTIDQRQAQIGRPYLGWSERIFDVAIDFNGAGSASSDEVKDQMNYLISRGYDLGPSGADGIPGPYYYNAVKAYQQFLKAYGYSGDVDGIWGAGTQAAHAKFTAASAPAFPPFPLAAGQYFGPEAGGANSISGYHSHNADLKVWQQRMKDRGWTITVDGQYGPVGATTPQGETADIAGQFQAEKKLVVDKFIGRQTWDAAWLAPVTPAPGEEPTPPPVVVSPPPVVVPPVTNPDVKYPTTGLNASGRPAAEIQKFLITKGFLPAGSDDNVWGPQTSVGVAKYQESQFIGVDGTWGRTSDGLAFPPAGSIHGVDYSFSRPDPAMLASRGVKLVGRYLWPAKYASKGITKAELDALKAKSIKTFFIFEQDGKELLGGFAAGVAVATRAEDELKILGLERYPIYFNVDYDAPDSDMAKILDALRGVASVIGLNRVGLYAGYKPLKAAFDAKVITWGFQTYAWSGGQWDARAHLQQWSNGQWGDSVDFTRAVKAEYGQNPVAKPAPTPTPTPVPLPLPETVLVPKKVLDLIKLLPAELRKLADDIDEYLV